MVGITREEQNKVKRMKRTEDSLRDLWNNANAPTFELQGSQKKKRKRKGMRKFLNTSKISKNKSQDQMASQDNSMKHLEKI